MQGAPPDQMGASYPHMFLILLLLRGANAALKSPAGPKWQTLSGITYTYVFYTFLVVFFFNQSAFASNIFLLLQLQLLMLLLSPYRRSPSSHSSRRILWRVS